MIWLKRLLPLVLLAIAWFGYTWIRDTRARQQAETDTHHALVTAQVWVATADHRADPLAYLAYRDSLLQANNITPEQMFRYLESFERDIQRQLTFSQLVSHYVDSLVRLRDTTRQSGS